MRVHWKAAVLGATALVAFAGAGVGRPARVSAQPAGNALTGTWRAGTTHIEVAVESWGEDCGPRPESSRSAGGGIVNIEQVGGQLVIHGRGQDIRSDACWSRNPSMRRKSAKFASNAWSTACSTPANDPREEQGTYTMRVVAADTLTYQDISRYNWALNQSRCVAKFTTVQTLTRGNAQEEEAAAPQPSKPIAASAPAEPQTVVVPPEPEEKERACTPGAPRKLTLRPRRAEIDVGQRVCIRPRLADAKDCPIANPTVTWSLSHSKALRGTLANGCFTAADTAAEAEGEFKIVAAASGQRAEAIVAVSPVDLSALIAKRMSAPPLNTFEEEPLLAAAPKAVTRVATRRTTEAPSTSPRKLLGAALGVAATLLAIAALWLSRRKADALATSGVTPLPARLRRTSDAADTGPVLLARGPGPNGPSAYPPADRTAVIAPVTVTRDQDDVALRRKELDETKPVPLSAAAAPSVSSAASEAETPWICPKCRVGYPAHQRTCPKDGSQLMPYAQFAQGQRKPETEHARRCPHCGSTFPADAAFCSEDGTRLVEHRVPSAN